MAVDAQPLGATLGGTDRRGTAGEGGQQQQQQRQEQRSLQQQLAQAQAQALAAAKQQHQQPNQQGSGFDAEPMSVDPADGRQHGGRDGEQGGRSSKRSRGDEEMQYHHRHGRSRSRSPGGDGGRDRWVEPCTHMKGTGFC
jgi:type II secretory pathway pseudopilin PulG